MRLLLATFSILLQASSLTLAQTQAPPPGPAGPTNITAVLAKAGQFTTLTHLLATTQVGDQINTQLNNSNQGLTIFAPTDNAFTSLKPGMLNSLTSQQKVQLVQFHIIPNYIPISEFQTASNPLRTQAGDIEFSLNVTSSGNQVNITTGVVNTTVSNSVYGDGKLAVYQVDRVLLPLEFFESRSSPPAPSPGKSKSKGHEVANAPSEDSRGFRFGVRFGMAGLVGALFFMV